MKDKTERTEAMSREDRELLERAAKAAGMFVLDNKPWPDVDGWFFCLHHDSPALHFRRGDRKPDHERPWMPLDDDGDALRLAVKLNIQIAPDPANGMICAWIAHPEDAEPIEETICIELWRDSNTNAATRRAIVRAAASLTPNSGEDGQHG